MNQSKYPNKGSSKNDNAKFKKTMGIILGVLIVIAVILGCSGAARAIRPQNPTIPPPVSSMIPVLWKAAGTKLIPTRSSKT